MENTFIARPLSKPAFQLVQPEQSHPRLSLRRVLYVKFLRWVEKSSASALIKTTLKCSMLLLSCVAIMLPHFALGMLTAAIHLPILSRVGVYCAALALTLNVKPLLRLAKRVYAKRGSKSNQHMYHGIPLDTFVSYLFSKGSFTTAAISDLGLSQRKWARIADELENGDVLRRGENNARILNPRMDREVAVKQIRDGFPMTQDVASGEWVEKRGRFDAWVLQRERSEAKRKEESEKLDRKIERSRENIKRLREEASAFDTVMAMAQA